MAPAGHNIAPPISALPVAHLIVSQMILTEDQRLGKERAPPLDVIRCHVLLPTTLPPSINVTYYQSLVNETACFATSTTLLRSLKTSHSEE